MQASGLTAWELLCRRGDRELFGSLDLWLERGEALHLVGPNGIGKSSLIQILAGLRRPSEGYASSGLPARGRVHWEGSVGLVDHRPALDEDQPLGKALGFWRRLDHADPPLERVGIDRLIDVPVRYLSAGQRKRAALARLLIQQADNWLLDEPLNGLDTEGATLVETLIAERRAQGGVVVVASHQPVSLPGARILDLRDHPA
jgi:heme exporter protein A